MARSTATWPSLPALALSAAGCITTGQAWVQQPENSLIEPSSEQRVAAADLEPLSVAQSAPLRPPAAADAPRPRLSHVVSLGESVASEAPPPAASPSPSAGAAPVTVNIVNYLAPAYDYGYSAPPFRQESRLRGHGSAHSRSTAASRSADTPPVAHDWRAPASYGPIFPYRTSPASPWQRPR